MPGEEVLLERERRDEQGWEFWPQHGTQIWAVCEDERAQMLFTSRIPNRWSEE